MWHAESPVSLPSSRNRRSSPGRNALSCLGRRSVSGLPGSGVLARGGAWARRAAPSWPCKLQKGPLTRCPPPKQSLAATWPSWAWQLTGGVTGSAPHRALPDARREETTRGDGSGGRGFRSTPNSMCAERRPPAKRPRAASNAVPEVLEFSRSSSQPQGPYTVAGKPERRNQRGARPQHTRASPTNRRDVFVLRAQAPDGRPGHPPRLARRPRPPPRRPRRRRPPQDGPAAGLGGHPPGPHRVLPGRRLPAPRHAAGAGGRPVLRRRRPGVRRVRPSARSPPRTLRR